MKGWAKFLLLAALVAHQAQALTLDEARRQGRVGETLNGYLAPRQQDKETLALVKQINQGREEHYRQIPQRNRLTTAEVARIAGRSWCSVPGRESMCSALTGSG